MPRQKQLFSLKQIQEKTGISYPTLINYARDHADEIPSEGEGRTRRYPLEAVKAFQRIKAGKKPGRRPAEERAPAAPARKTGRKATRGARRAQDRSATAPPAVPSALHLEPATLPLGPLQLAEEDRQLLRDLTEALRNLGGNVRSLSMGVGEVSTSLFTGGTGDVGSSRKKPAKKAAQKRSPRRGSTSEAGREILTRSEGAGAS